MLTRPSQGLYGGIGHHECPTPEHAHVAKPLAASRARTFAGFVRCVERGIAMGELAEGASARAIGNAFNSSLLGVSISVRGGVKLPTINVSIAQVMTLWDASKR